MALGMGGEKSKVKALGARKFFSHLPCASGSRCICICICVCVCASICICNCICNCICIWIWICRLIGLFMHTSTHSTSFLFPGPFPCQSSLSLTMHIQPRPVACNSILRIRNVGRFSLQLQLLLPLHVACGIGAWEPCHSRWLTTLLDKTCNTPQSARPAYKRNTRIHFICIFTDSFTDSSTDSFTDSLMLMGNAQRHPCRILLILPYARRLTCRL